MFICAAEKFQYAGFIRMSFRLAILAACVLALWSLAPGPLPAAPQGDAGQFFAGTVVEHTPAQITVARVLQGKNESRSFRITPETKVEGSVTPQARVTVGYVTTEDGDRATLIIVRTDPPGKRKNKK